MDVPGPERRLAAVLAADMVGYPRRPETDTALALREINGARSLWPPSSARFTAISSRQPSLALWRPRECADDGDRYTAAGLPQYQRFPGPRLRRLSHGLGAEAPTHFYFEPFPRLEDLSTKRAVPYPPPPAFPKKAPHPPCGVFAFRARYGAQSPATSAAEVWKLASSQALPSISSGMVLQSTPEPSPSKGFEVCKARSSVVEHSTVNRMVAGSNPARGATQNQ
jgi:hypothetical protein